jgi:hypothetical protein
MENSVKDHAIALARAFEAPIVLLHSRGHVVPPLQHTHLASLRAFLLSIQQHGPPEQYQQRQAQVRAAGGLEPLDPPLPLWETEAEQVQKLQQHKQQSRQSQQQQGRYVQHVKIDSSVGNVPQLAPKLGSKL